jgi:CHAT domain-containing protein
VVLSACETGRGHEVKGEGLIGLTRALQYAGARSIVASQWKVADQSTATLMVAFDRSLRQGLPKDEALRQAMARLRQNPATSHPYYWAPFVLIGDSDNSVLSAVGTSQ